MKYFLEVKAQGQSQNELQADFHRVQQKFFEKIKFSKVSREEISLY